jgi:hypothetical protein
LRDFLIALSLANLLFLRAWEKAKFGSYLEDLKPDGPNVALLVLITCIALLIGWRLARASRRPALFGQVVFLLLLLIPINAIRLYYQQTVRFVNGNRYDLIAMLCVAVVCAPFIFAAATRRLRFRFVVRYGIFLVLALAPFTLFTLGEVTLQLMRARAGGAPPTATAPAPRPAVQRVIWIIFDELDERTAFVDRPSTVAMPELDRFRRESFVATAAYPPGNATLYSIPALLGGQAVKSVYPRDKNLEVTYENASGPVVWSPGLTIFSETRAAGFQSGLVGAFFPYCRTIGSVVSDCRDFRSREGWRRQTSKTLANAFEAVPFAFRMVLRRRMSQGEVERYQMALADALDLVADRKLDLVYLHFPLPHPPGIYDRATGRLELSRQRSYLDNLALTDVTFGELRRAMERAGVWQDSVMIVSADHWWRAEELWRPSPYWMTEEQEAFAGRTTDHRVPFIVKLAGNPSPAVYQRSFNTLVTRKTVMALLKGQINTSKDLAGWLDSQATDAIRWR